MIRRLYFVRHCHYDNPLHIFAGRLPLRLSEVGKRQGEALVAYFSKKTIDAIYSSHVERCSETAALISRGITPVVYDTRLLEVLSAKQGYWELEGNQWATFYGDRETLGGEGFDAVMARGASFLRDILLTDEHDIVICSHGDVLYLMYCWLFKITPLGETENKEAGVTRGYLHKGETREIIIEGDSIRDGEVFVSEIYD
jgi:alpha-ribazole phosphatase